MADVPDDDGPRKDDGLDLARQLTRATAKSSPAARKRRAKRDDRPRDSKVSGAHPDDRDPQPLGAQVERLVADHGWELELRVRGVFARWPELVGAEVGAHCTPESLHRRQARRTHRLDRLGHPADPPLPGARAPPQRGAR